MSRLKEEDAIIDIKKHQDPVKATLLTEIEEVKEGETRPIPNDKVYYYAGISRMTNGFVQEQICNTEEMERLEEIIEQRQRAKGYNSSGQKYNSYGEDYGGEAAGGSDEE